MWTQSNYSRKQSLPPRLLRLREVRLVFYGTAQPLGVLTKQTYTAGRNYGVRVTNVGDGKFRLDHLVEYVSNLALGEDAGSRLE